MLAVFLHSMHVTEAAACGSTGDDGPSASGDAPGQQAAAPDSSSQVPWEGPDESQETTSLQLRLADGSRMVRSLIQFPHDTKSPSRVTGRKCCIALRENHTMERTL